MNSTEHYRLKYVPQSYGSHGKTRFRAGGEDVYKLCDAVDQLVALVRDLQGQVDVDQQSDIERRLMTI